MTKKFFPDFTKQEYDRIIESVERRQHNYVCGDKMYNELGGIAAELKRRQQAARPFAC
jgi:hypothetical protein|tara:strand:+ start:404 stop:577 length:174 start_codon:yes stop_codon:yes gene_type:complete